MMNFRVEKKQSILHDQARAVTHWQDDAIQ